MLLNILIGLLLLSVLVFLHEAGHFIAARLCGVDVLAFSVGFGPVLLKKKIGKTEYRLSLLPFANVGLAIKPCNLGRCSPLKTGKQAA